MFHFLSYELALLFIKYFLSYIFSEIKKMQNNSTTTKSSSMPSLHLKSIGVDGYFSWLESRLFKTIIALCTDRTPFESVSEYLPQLDVLLIRNTILEQRRLAASLWITYMELINVAPKGL